MKKFCFALAITLLCGFAFAQTDGSKKDVPFKLAILKRMGISDDKKSPVTGESCKAICLAADSGLDCELKMESRKYQCHVESTSSARGRLGR